jgi:hypothetical protein
MLAKSRMLLLACHLGQLYLSDFWIDELHLRTPGYPLLLLLTGSSQAPTRTLFFTSLLLHFASVWLLASALSCAGLTGLIPG